MKRDKTPVHDGKNQNKARWVEAATRAAARRELDLLPRPEALDLAAWRAAQVRAAKEHQRQVRRRAVGPVDSWRPRRPRRRARCRAEP